MAKKTGVEGALQDGPVKPGSTLTGAEPEQPGLLDELAEDDEAAGAMFGFALDRSKGGRPKGARNRNTEEVRRFIQAAGADPVVAASRIVRAGPAWVFEAAKEMERIVERNVDGELREITEAGIDPAKAWDIWMKAVEFLGPYVHSKQPIDVNIEQPGLAIQINVGSPEAAASIEAATKGRTRWTLDQEKSSTYEGEGEEVTQAESHTGDASD
jgi:hypothetical protein